MADDTTTGEDVIVDAGADDAQPVNNTDTQTADETTTTEPSETPTGDEAEETPDAVLPAIDDKLQTYAKSQGIEDVSELSERELKLLKTAQTNQAEATRNYRRTNELEKATAVTADQVPADATPEQKDNIRLRSLELKLEAQNWKQSNPDKAALEPAMVKLLTEDPNKKLLVQEGLLSYDDVYAMAKGSNDDSATVKSQGAQAALKSLASKQQAAVPAGNAVTNGTPKTKPFAELSLKEMEARLGTVRR